ncbi:haloacid dehalogenase type II [Babesia caballi]|uniref:Haloacid dehalogenase type II n=1 Tax=Babesia caballi TaxID=5871 RepID=A0AAV4LUC5_BABCB|nr:haloacid dehalogenase type II [Babesia caballi]
MVGGQETMLEGRLVVDDGLGGDAADNLPPGVGAATHQRAGAAQEVHDPVAGGVPAVGQQHAQVHELEEAADGGGAFGVAPAVEGRVDGVNHPDAGGLGGNVGHLALLHHAELVEVRLALLRATPQAKAAVHDGLARGALGGDGDAALRQRRHDFAHTLGSYLLVSHGLVEAVPAVLLQVAEVAREAAAVLDGGHVEVVEVAHDVVFLPVGRAHTAAVAVAVAVAIAVAIAAVGVAAVHAALQLLLLLHVQIGCVLRGDELDPHLLLGHVDRRTGVEDGVFHRSVLHTGLCVPVELVGGDFGLRLFNHYFACRVRSSTCIILDASPQLA